MALWVGGQLKVAAAVAGNVLVRENELTVEVNLYSVNDRKWLKGFQSTWQISREAALAIAAQRELVLEFCSIPIIVFPSNSNATCRGRFALLRVTGWLSVPSFTASALPTSACRHTAIRASLMADFISALYCRFWH